MYLHVLRHITFFDRAIDCSAQNIITVRLMTLKSDQVFLKRPSIRRFFRAKVYLLTKQMCISESLAFYLKTFVQSVRSHVARYYDEFVCPRGTYQTARPSSRNDFLPRSYPCFHSDARRLKSKLKQRFFACLRHGTSHIPSSVSLNRFAARIPTWFLCSSRRTC
jgi:hypothetical protein